MANKYLILSLNKYTGSFGKNYIYIISKISYALYNSDTKQIELYETKNIAYNTGNYNKKYKKDLDKIKGFFSYISKYNKTYFPLNEKSKVLYFRKKDDVVYCPEEIRNQLIDIILKENVVEVISLDKHNNSWLLNKTTRNNDYQLRLKYEILPNTENISKNIRTDLCYDTPDGPFDCEEKMQKYIENLK